MPKKKNDASRPAGRGGGEGERRKVAPLFRSARITADMVRGGADDEPARIELTFSSEEPVERWFGVEVLSHDPAHVRMDWISSGHAPFLLDHDRGAEAQIGVVEKAWIGDDRRARAIVRMSRSERVKDILADIEDGIRANVSVGYRVHRLELESEEDDKKTFRATDWEPFEVSLVTVPADAGVGVGRHEAAADENEAIFIERTGKMPAKYDDNANIGEDRPDVLPDDAAARAAATAVKEERKRVAEITALAARHNRRDLGEKAIGDGLTIEQFRGVLLDVIGDAQPIDNSVADLGMERKELERYSIMRAIRALKTGNWKGAEFERECSIAVAERVGKDPHGIYVPYDVQSAPLDTRDQNVGASTAGGHLVGTDHLAGSFIGLLRNRMKVRELGARVLNGLVGNVDIPKQTGGATGYWVGEGADVTESGLEFGQLTLSPKTVGTYVDMTRRLLLQSDPSIDSLVMSDLAKTLALTIDAAAIAGDGSSDNPTGVLNTSGIGLVPIGDNGGAPTEDHIIDLETEVAIDNADIGTLSYLTNAKVRGKLKKTVVETGDAMKVWQRSDVSGVGDLNGYYAHVSNQVPSDLTKGTGSNLSAILFGNWSDILLALWGVLDINVDTSTLSASGGVRVVALQSVDIGVRRAESFAAIKDAATS